VNFYLVANVYIFVFFVFTILSNIEMDKRFHEKYDKCDEGNYDKYGFHFLLYITPRISSQEYHSMDDDSVIVKYEIRIACNHAERFGNVGAFNGVGFIIVPICVLKAEVDVVRVIGNLGVREVAYRAVVRRWWIIIFYKDAFAIQVGIFRSFFSDEVHFAGLKVGWENESKWSHWLDGG